MERDSKLTNAPLRSRAPAIDLQHLRYAVAAADHGSFRRAPEVMLLRQTPHVRAPCLTLLSKAFPLLAAQIDRCPPKAAVKWFWITKEIDNTKKINDLFAEFILLRSLKNLA